MRHGACLFQAVMMAAVNESTMTSTNRAAVYPLLTITAEDCWDLNPDTTESNPHAS
jgi:hypothetical protein